MTTIATPRIQRQPPSQNPVFEITLQPHNQLTPNFRSTISAPPARQLESPALTQYSSVPIARDPTEPILQPARLSLTSAKHPKTPRQPPNLRPPPPPILQPIVCTTLCTRYPPDKFYFQHSFSTAQYSKINIRYTDTTPSCTQNHRHYPNPGTLGPI